MKQSGKPRLTTGERGIVLFQYKQFAITVYRIWNVKHKQRWRVVMPYLQRYTEVNHNETMRKELRTCLYTKQKLDQWLKEKSNQTDNE